MCKAWEDMKQATEQRTLVQNLRNLMETLHLSAEQTMDALKIPESRCSQLAEKLYLLGYPLMHAPDGAGVQPVLNDKV